MLSALTNMQQVSRQTFEAHLENKMTKISNLLPRLGFYSSLPSLCNDCSNLLKLLSPTSLTQSKLPHFLSLKTIGNHEIETLSISCHQICFRTFLSSLLAMNAITFKLSRTSGYQFFLFILYLK